VASGGSGPAVARAGGTLPRDSGGRRGRGQVGLDETGVRSSVAGCGARQRGERGGAALTSGADSTVRPIRFSNRIKFISNGFEFAPNFDRYKRCLPLLEKLKVKFGWKEHKIRNNFPFRNFSRFEKEFELKFRELL
jgi:hypothetical protein